MRHLNNAGFSMTELMVVIIIIGILAAIAIPRYNIFVARARQGEAQANLGQIFKLQESYKLRHGSYDNGSAPAWNTDAAFRGYDQTRNCGPNSLGFTFTDCDEVRYKYWIAGADEDEFVVVARAVSGHASDATIRTNMRIFPNCNGAGASRDIVAGNLSTGTGGWVTLTGSQSPLTVAATATTLGDAWYIDQSRNLVNYRDIVDYCD